MNSQTLPDLFESEIYEAKKPGFFYRPHNFFLICIVILVAIPIVCWAQGILIHMDKPRIYISADIFMYSVAVVLFLHWITYHLAKRRFANVSLIWIHVCLTLFVISFFIITHVWYLKFLEPDKLKAFFLKSALNNRTREIKLFSPLGICFLIGQLAFFINLFFSNSKKTISPTEV
jgi:hypothetical protein